MKIVNKLGAHFVGLFILLSSIDYSVLYTLFKLGLSIVRSDMLECPLRRAQCTLHGVKINDMPREGGKTHSWSHH